MWSVYHPNNPKNPDNPNPLTLSLDWVASIQTLI